jgi:hypothetical protein
MVKEGMEIVALVGTVIGHKALERQASLKITPNYILM